jgi:hypothetical protein
MKAGFAQHFSTLLIFIDILASISILATIIDTTTDNLAFAFKPTVPPTNDTQKQPLQELPRPSITKDEATPISKQRADAITSTSLGQFLTYENATYGIKMDYPSNWITSGYNLTDPITNIVSFHSPEPSDYVMVNIYLDNLSKSYSTLPQLYEYLRLSIDGYKLYPEVWPGFKHMY